MNKQKQMLKYLENVLSNIEVDIKRVKGMIQQLQQADEQGNIPDAPTQSLTVNTVGLQSYDEDNAKVVEGVFDGYFMTGADSKKYPVPTNYASKSKLVPGDQLKLKIMEDGKLIYKLTHPADRKHCKAVISLDEHKKFIGITDQGEIYQLNQAAVTFFKGQPGDEAYIIAHVNANSGYAAIETIIKPHQMGGTVAPVVAEKTTTAESASTPAVAQNAETVDQITSVETAETEAKSE